MKYGDKVELISICRKLSIKVVNIMLDIDAPAINKEAVINCPLPA